MGRLGGLSAAMSNVAEKLKKDRLIQQEIKQKKALRSPLETLIEQAKGIEAADVMERPDIARAIRSGTQFKPRQPKTSSLGMTPELQLQPTIQQPSIQEGVPSIEEATQFRPKTVKVDPFGKLKPETFERVPTKTEKQQMLESGGEKQTFAQERKKGAELQRQVKTAHLKMNTMFGAWLDTVNRTFELTGVPPGPVQAPLTKILGATKINEFQEAFKGAKPEYAAAVGRMAIPGARSVRLIDLFKRGAADEWSTVTSGIQNSSKSARMALAGYLATDEGTRALGVVYNPNNPEAWNYKASQALNTFEDIYKEGLYEMVYIKNPDLLSDSIRGRLDEEFMAEMQRRDSQIRR